MSVRLVMAGVVAGLAIGNVAGADPGWVVLKVSRVQVKPKKVDGTSWDLAAKENAAGGCWLVGFAGKAVGTAVGGPTVGEVGGAIATSLCGHSSAPQPQRDARAPDLFVQVVAGDARYRSPIALDTFAEAFDFSVVVPLDGIPAAGLQLQVLDQDNEVGTGELVGMVRVTKRQVQSAIAAGSPLLTLSDSQVEKIELEVEPYTFASTTSSSKFDVNKAPTALGIKARAGELVTITARGKYSVADNHEQLDENGYTAGQKRSYNRKDFANANHATAIAFVGGPTESHTALVVGSCVAAVTSINGTVYVGVNDDSVGNNQGMITFSVKITLPTLDQWRSGGAFTCPEQAVAESKGQKPAVDAVDPSLPDIIDRTMISDGVGKLKGDVTACGTKFTAKGQVKIAVNVGADGRVSRATVKSTPDVALGDCVASVMQSATFPKSKSGASFLYPFEF